MKKQKNMGKRILAELIDMELILFVATIFMYIASKITGRSILYFAILFPVLLLFYRIIMELSGKGQTIGKKLLKIRVVDNETNNPANMKQIILRSLFIYNVISMILSILLVYIIPKNNYFVGVTLITIIESIFIIITTIMVVYRKDKRGLHDIIGKTKVISERG